MMKKMTKTKRMKNMKTKRMNEIVQHEAKIAFGSVAEIGDVFDVDSDYEINCVLLSIWRI